MRSGVVALVLLGLAVAGVSCFGLIGSIPGLENPRANAAIQAYLNTIIASNPDAPSAAIFARLGPLGLGYKSWKAGPIQENSILRLASITKMFTLKEWFEHHGLLRVRQALNDHPSSYGFSPSQYQGSDVMTYKNVASMTGGILDYTLRISASIENDTIVWDPATYTVAGNVDLGWKNENLTFPPGSEFLYSNTHCEVIGETLNRMNPLGTAALIKRRWRFIAPSLQIDDGLLPESQWPQTSGYLPWYYPAALPGVSGTLRGTARDVLTAFNLISRDEFMSFRRQWNNVPYSNLPGAGTQAGDKYGLFWQHYDIQGDAEGHDGDLNVRSIIFRHQRTQRAYFFHFAQPIPNSQLLDYVRELVRLDLQ